METQCVDLVLAVLKNLGIDTTCGACMEIGFCGVTTAAHTCAQEVPVVTVELGVPDEA